MGLPKFLKRGKATASDADTSSDVSGGVSGGPILSSPSNVSLNNTVSPQQMQAQLMHDDEIANIPPVPVQMQQHNSALSEQHHQHKNSLQGSMAPPGALGLHTPPNQQRFSSGGNPQLQLQQQFLLQQHQHKQQQQDDSNLMHPSSPPRYSDQHLHNPYARPPSQSQQPAMQQYNELPNHYSMTQKDIDTHLQLQQQQEQQVQQFHASSSSLQSAQHLQAPAPSSFPPPPTIEQSPAVEKKKGLRSLFQRSSKSQRHPENPLSPTTPVSNTRRHSPSSSISGPPATPSVLQAINPNNNNNDHPALSPLPQGAVSPLPPTPGYAPDSQQKQQQSIGSGYNNTMGLARRQSKRYSNTAPAATSPSQRIQQRMSQIANSEAEHQALQWQLQQQQQQFGDFSSAQQDPPGQQQQRYRGDCSVSQHHQAQAQAHFQQQQMQQPQPSLSAGPNISNLSSGPAGNTNSAPVSSFAPTSSNPASNQGNQGVLAQLQIPQPPTQHHQQQSPLIHSPQPRRPNSIHAAAYPDEQLIPTPSPSNNTSGGGSTSSHNGNFVPYHQQQLHQQLHQQQQQQHLYHDNPTVPDSASQISRESPPVDSYQSSHPAALTYNLQQQQQQQQFQQTAQQQQQSLQPHDPPSMSPTLSRQSLDVNNAPSARSSDSILPPPSLQQPQPPPSSTFINTINSVSSTTNPTSAQANGPGIPYRPVMPPPAGSQQSTSQSGQSQQPASRNPTSYRSDNGGAVSVPSDIDRASPQPSTMESEDNKLKELTAKYKHVKRLYFDNKKEIEDLKQEKDTLTDRIESLQNAVANQRITSSRTVLDDHEYSVRFDRLNTAIKQFSYKLRKNWKKPPQWAEKLITPAEVKAGGKEMMACGRATINRWLYENVFQRCFHPALEPSLSIGLKNIESVIRQPTYTFQNPEEYSALTEKLVTWRMATFEGLKPQLYPVDEEGLKKKKELEDAFQQLIQKDLMKFIEEHVDTQPGHSAAQDTDTILQSVISIMNNLPMESRDVAIVYPVAGQLVDPNTMTVVDGPGSEEDAKPSEAPMVVRFTLTFGVSVTGRHNLCKADVWALPAPAPAK